MLISRRERGLPRVPRFPFPVSRQLLFPIPEFFQHAGKATDIAAKRLEEFLVCPLDEMDELTSEAATSGGWAQRVGARVARMVGATHELFSLERAEHLRRRHGVGACVACEHDLRHRLTLLGERRDAGEEHHLKVGEAGITERSALAALPAVHRLPEEYAGTCNG